MTSHYHPVRLLCEHLLGCLNHTWTNCKSNPFCCSTLPTYIRPLKLDDTDALLSTMQTEKPEDQMLALQVSYLCPFDSSGQRIWFLSISCFTHVLMRLWPCLWKHYASLLSQVMVLAAVIDGKWNSSKAREITKACVSVWMRCSVVKVANDRAFIKTDPFFNSTAWHSFTIASPFFSIVPPMRHEYPSSSLNITCPWTMLLIRFPR